MQGGVGGRRCRRQREHFLSASIRKTWGSHPLSFRGLELWWGPQIGKTNEWPFVQTPSSFSSAFWVCERHADVTWGNIAVLLNDLRRLRLNLQTHLTDLPAGIYPALSEPTFVSSVFLLVILLAVMAITNQGSEQGGVNQKRASFGQRLLH